MWERGRGGGGKRGGDTLLLILPPTTACAQDRKPGGGGGGQHQAGRGRAPPSSFAGAPAALLPLRTPRSGSWTSSVIFSSRCFDSTRKNGAHRPGPINACLPNPDPVQVPVPDRVQSPSRSPSFLAAPCTHQLASGGRPCTRQAAGLGDKEWPVGQRWLVAGGEGVGRASTCGWSARRSRRRVHLLDQCSPQICPRPRHTGTVAG